MTDIERPGYLFLDVFRWAQERDIAHRMMGEFPGVIAPPSISQTRR